MRRKITWLSDSKSRLPHIKYCPWQLSALNTDIYYVKFMKAVSLSPRSNLSEKQTNK